MRDRENADSSLHSARLQIGIVGAGRVGAPMGAALARAGHRVIGVSAISDSSRNRAEALLEGTPILPADEVVKNAQLVLLAIPDDVLPEFIEGAAKAELFKAGQIIVHTAGRFGVGVLEPATRCGALGMAIHPIMTFTGTTMDVERMHGAIFGVTAPSSILPIAEALVIEIGGEPTVIAEGDRVAYHAALAWSANFLNTLVAEGMDQLREIGVVDPARALMPLLNAVLDNVLRNGDQALTGPIARADAKTVAAHLQVMAERTPEIRNAYEVLARLTLHRATNAGLLRAQDAAEIERLLGGDDATG
ncbi:MAG TPA: DUF2520 domain-containing protein [Candidatus Nanopelagicaceae bacterium]|nr:DUF2520 domain-containing protein [Candidatus Nanopelagicaceae bacterium]